MTSRSAASSLTPFNERAAVAQSMALTCVHAAAALIDAVHSNPEKLDEVHMEGLVVLLSTCCLGQLVLDEVLPELLDTHIGPARFAGIERQTAHSAAFAIAEKVVQAISGEGTSSVIPPQPATSDVKLTFDLPAIRRRLLEIQPFDGVLRAEMIGQETAALNQIHEARQEAERRAKALATIEEQHRTTRTKTEVAEMCGVHPRTVNRWIKSGKLRCAEDEGKCVFDIRELEAVARGKKRVGKGIVKETDPLRDS